jgi:hypothetical protein
VLLLLMDSHLSPYEAVGREVLSPL